jgi:membrane protease subunit (stomatin/prohibitin family)
MIKQNALPAAGFLIAALLTVSVPVQSSESGAFIGGIMAARVGRNMRERTEAEQQQAAAAQQQAYQSQPVQQAAPAAAQTPEQRIQQLDKLAAGGYITAAEYKAKKQAIIDSM